MASTMTPKKRRAYKLKRLVISEHNYLRLKEWDRQGMRSTTSLIICYAERGFIDKGKRRRRNCQNNNDCSSGSNKKALAIGLIRSMAHLAPMT
jgi:hypothetical protein